MVKHQLVIMDYREGFVQKDGKGWQRIAKDKEW